MANVLRRTELFSKHHKLCTVLKATYLQNSDPKVVLYFTDQSLDDKVLDESFNE